MMLKEYKDKNNLTYNELASAIGCSYNRARNMTISNQCTPRMFARLMKVLPDISIEVVDDQRAIISPINSAERDNKAKRGHRLKPHCLKCGRPIMFLPEESVYCEFCHQKELERDRIKMIDSPDEGWIRLANAVFSMIRRDLVLAMVRNDKGQMRRLAAVLESDHIQKLNYGGLRTETIVGGCAKVASKIADRKRKVD